MSLFRKFRCLITKFLPLSVALLFQITAAGAHELRPAIIDVGVLEGAPDHLTINLTFSGEAFLAGIDLSAVSNTDDSSGAGMYDELRAMPPTSLAERVTSSFATLSGKVTVKSDGQPLSLELVAVEVADEPDLNLARDTILEVRSDLPKPGEAISIEWPPAMGALLIHQMGAGSNPGTDYLPNGGVSQTFTHANLQRGR